MPFPPHLFPCLRCRLHFSSYNEAWEHHDTVHQRRDNEPLSVLLYADVELAAQICALPEATRRRIRAQLDELEIIQNMRALAVAPVPVPAPVMPAPVMPVPVRPVLVARAPVPGPLPARVRPPPPLRPASIELRVTLHHPESFLATRGVTQFAQDPYTFTTRLAVTAPATQPTLLVVVRKGFEANWGVATPHMRWKEWISVRFVLVVGGRPHEIIGNAENILPRDGTWMGVEIGEA